MVGNKKHIMVAWEGRKEGKKKNDGKEMMERKMKERGKEKEGKEGTMEEEGKEGERRGK